MPNLGSWDKGFLVDAYLDELVRVMPKPTEELAAPPWAESRAGVGLEFPSDYRAFVDLYGGGSVSVGRHIPRLFIYAPCSQSRMPGGATGFRDFMDRTELSFYIDYDGGEGVGEEMWGDGPFYRVRPHPGGLLAWGENEEGDVFFWLTEDPDPDRWPIVVWARGPFTTFRFDGGMVRFLRGALAGEHPMLGWMATSGATWDMDNDWLRRAGLN